MRKGIFLYVLMLGTLYSCVSIPKLPETIIECDRLSQKEFGKLSKEERVHYKKIADKAFRLGDRTSALDVYMKLSGSEGISGLEGICEVAERENDPNLQLYKNILTRMREKAGIKTLRVYGPEIPSYNFPMPQKRPESLPYTRYYSK